MTLSIFFRKFIVLSFVLCEALGTDLQGRESENHVAEVGELTGRFVYDGQPPTPKELHPELAKLEANSELSRDNFGRVSGTQMSFQAFLRHKIRPKTVDESLLVEKDGGIANVLVWAESKDMPWTPPAGDLPAVTIQVKDGRFAPRMTVVLVGQPLHVESHDPVGINFRASLGNPFNQPLNGLLRPGSGDSVRRITFAEQEQIPVRIQSDIAVWTECYLFVRGNPYVAISQADGTFTIPRLPVGEWEFRAWHERKGYLQHWPMGLFKQSIRPGENNLGEIKIKPNILALKPTK